MKSAKELNEISRILLDSAILVHKEMGPGLLESVYETCLAYDLRDRGMKVESQVPVQLFFRGKKLDKEFRVDLLLEREIIVEIKAVDALLSVHEAQLISYLKLTGKRLGFLINFNVPLLKNGFRRFINGSFY